MRADAQLLRAHLKARCEYMRAVTGRRPPQRKRLPRQQQPNGIRLSYYRELRPVVDLAHEQLARTLYAVGPALFEQIAKLRGDSVRTDETALEHLVRLIRQAADAVTRRFPAAVIGGIARTIGRRVSTFQAEQLQKQARAALGVDVVRSEPWLQHRLEAFTAENVSLIKSVHSQYFGEVEKLVLHGATSGARWEDVSRELEQRFGIAKRRAKLIARDQVGKFYGDLNHARQTDLGLSHYVWRGMNDNRERPAHLAREGRKYAWSKPPGDGNPGQPVNCRCYAEPDFSPLLEGT